MNRGGASFRGRSKATPTTLCQKCLKRDIYECTASAQERPYKPRPSRTQQLLNPSLKPKLMTEVPNDLLRKKGVADEVLAKKDEERGREPRRIEDRARPSSSRRSRSISSYSSDSVSTISTNLSRSRSRSRPISHSKRNRSPSRSRSRSRHRVKEHRAKGSLRGDAQELGKRRRKSVSSADSYYSNSSYERGRAEDRNTRRRMSSFSPERRGRRRSRSAHSRRVSLSPRRSISSSRSRSPTRGKHGRDPRSRSPYRAPRSPSPPRRLPRRSPSPVRGRPEAFGRAQNGARAFQDRPAPPPPPPPAQNGPPPQLQRERSLSPYSKRVALTRAMNIGR